MKTQLEVGDKIHRIRNKEVERTFEIERVTKTQAIAKGGKRFMRSILNDWWITVFGESNSYYHVIKHKLAGPENE